MYHSFIYNNPICFNKLFSFEILVKVCYILPMYFSKTNHIQDNKALDNVTAGSPHPTHLPSNIAPWSSFSFVLMFYLPLHLSLFYPRVMFHSIRWLLSKIYLWTLYALGFWILHSHTQYTNNKSYRNDSICFHGRAMLL